VIPESQAGKTAAHGYMAHQTDVNSKMRAILIDWLLEVHFKFKLLPETLYLTINIIDRYLERKPVVRTKLQLVGVTAMLVASKFEEIYPPEVKDFVFITSNAYSHDDILDMEARMLNTLRFEVTVPTAWVFLGRYCKVAMLDSRTKQLAQYYIERCMQEYDMLRFLPSLQSSAAIYAAMRTMGTGTWNATLVGYTGHTEAEILPVVAEMERYVCHHSATLKAARKKFCSKRCGDIASIGIRLANGTVSGMASLAATSSSSSSSSSSRA
jgi:cyclin B